VVVLLCGLDWFRWHVWNDFTIPLRISRQECDSCPSFGGFGSPLDTSKDGVHVVNPDEITWNRSMPKRCDWVNWELDENIWEPESLSKTEHWATYEGPLPTERPAENNCCEANWDILTSQHGTHTGARRFQYNFLKFAHLRGCNETLVCAATSPITFSEIWPRRLRSTFEAGICGSLCLKRQKMRACSALLGCYSDAHVNSDWCFQKIQDCVLKLETDSV
jgi:hypothetical protein